MSAITKKECYDYMKKHGFRFTRGRKALIEILENEHLTFKQIQDRLAERGYTNVSSVYNMLEFFIDKEFVAVLHIGGVKYYDLCIGNKMHSSNSYIHMSLKNTGDIIEISNESLYNRIKETIERDYNVNLEYIKIIIGAENKQEEEE